MSKAGGGRGGGGGGGAASSRVKIPESVRSTILNIREITGKQHTDDDIYSVLRDCSMDPNDTAQKLLYLDTFHEVKRKRDKKKEVNQISGVLNRGARSGWGNNSGKLANSDGTGGRNATRHRENGAFQRTEKGPSMSLPVKERVKSDAAAPETKSLTVIPNGPSRSINGSSGRDPRSPTGKDANLVHDKSDDNVKKLSSLSLLSGVPSSTPDEVSESAVQAQQENVASPASLSGVYSSSDPVLPPSIARNPGNVGAIKREVRSQPSAVEKKQGQGNKQISPIVETELPNKNENVASTVVHNLNEITASGKIKAADVSETPKHSLSTQDSVLANHPASAVDDFSQAKESDVPLKDVASLEDAQIEKSSELLPAQVIANGHVIFPDHFKVPEAIKSGLTFGSFDSDSGPATEHGNDYAVEVNSVDAVGLPYGNDEPAREPASSDQSISSTVANHPDLPDSAQTFDKAPEPESDVALAPDSKFDKPAQETMRVSEGHQNPTVHIAPNYAYGIMPPIQAGPFIQFEGHPIQARDASRLPGSMTENPTTSSSPNPSPSPTPPLQNLAASPQPFLFRPPYPSNYFPYNPYYNPYFLPPMHHFLAHNGLPQQPPAGNAYLGPTAAAPGVKFPVPQFKPGTTTANPTPVGIQSLYGSYGSSPIGFNPGPPVTSGNPPGNEDLSAPQLKESQIYATGPLSDVSGWVSAPGQDVSSLHLNPLYHLTPQGQPLAFSPAQPGHGPYPGIYPPVQTIAAPSTVLQQTQGVSAPVETVGHPATAYQQPTQINWNASC